MGVKACWYLHLLAKKTRHFLISNCSCLSFFLSATEISLFLFASLSTCISVTFTSDLCLVVNKSKKRKCSSVLDKWNLRKQHHVCTCVTFMCYVRAENLNVFLFFRVDLNLYINAMRQFTHITSIWYFANGYFGKTVETWSRGYKMYSYTQLICI